MRRQGILASRRLGVVTPPVDPGQPTKAYRYQRFTYDPQFGSAGEGLYLIGLTELRVYETAAGPDVAPLAILTASEAGGSIQNATDGNDATYWESNQNGRDRPVTITLDFGATPRSFDHLVIKGRIVYSGEAATVTQRSPAAWIWEGSNDGAAWDNLSHPRNSYRWTSGEERTFYRTDAQTFYKIRLGKSQSDQFTGGNRLTPMVAGVDLRSKVKLIWASSMYNLDYTPQMLLSDDSYADWVTYQNGGFDASYVAFSMLTKDAASIDALSFTARRSYQASTPSSLQITMAVGADTDDAFKPVKLSNFSWYPPFGDNETRTFATGGGTSVMTFRFDMPKAIGSGAYTSVTDFRFYDAAQNGNDLSSNAMRAYASSFSDRPQGAIDQNTGTQWSTVVAQGGTVPSWIEIDVVIPNANLVKLITAQAPANGVYVNEFPASFSVRARFEDGDWSPLGTFDSSGVNTALQVFPMPLAA
jgi:hypothetical protein